MATLEPVKNLMWYSESATQKPYFETAQLLKPNQYFLLFIFDTKFRVRSIFRISVLERPYISILCSTSKTNSISPLFFFFFFVVNFETQNQVDRKPDTIFGISDLRHPYFDCFLDTSRLEISKFSLQITLWGGKIPWVTIMRNFKILKTFFIVRRSDFVYYKY